MAENDILRVLQFTDTHLSADAGKTYRGINTGESLGRVIRYALDHYSQAELSLVTGDLVHDETSAAYERFKSHFELLNMPVLCLPGNHDLPDLMDEILSNGHVRTGRSTLVKSWQVVLLDSTVPGKVGGHLHRQELDRLEQCLTGHPDHYALICLHHPPFLTGSHWLDNGLLLDNSESLFNILDRHDQVRCVVWGHIHQEFQTVRNGVSYFATPSTMIQFKPDSYEFTLDDKPPGFRWLDLHANGDIETGVVYL